MQVSHYPQNLPNNAHMVYPQLIEAIKSTDTLVEGSMDSDVALIWSVLWSGKMSENKKVWDHYRNQGKPVIVIEVGGLVRNKTWKLGINGVNRDADFAVDTYEGSDRLVKLGLIKQPWKHTGEYVLVCGQHGDSQQWSKRFVLLLINPLYFVTILVLIVLHTIKNGFSLKIVLGMFLKNYNKLMIVLT